jgi:hypothetical protein
VFEKSAKKSPKTLFRKNFSLGIKKAEFYAAKRLRKNVINKKAEEMCSFSIFTNDHEIFWFKTFLGKHFSPDLKQTCNFFLHLLLFSQFLWSY